MGKDTTGDDAASPNAGVAGPVTRAMVHARTMELAVLSGRAPTTVSQADYEQAKLELTGESEPERQMAVLDSVPGPTNPGIPPDPAETHGGKPAPLALPPPAIVNSTST